MVEDTEGPGEGGSEYVTSNCDKKKTLFRWVHDLLLPLEIWKFNMHIQDDLLYTYSQSCIALSNRILIQTDM